MHLNSISDHAEVTRPSKSRKVVAENIKTLSEDDVSNQSDTICAALKQGLVVCKVETLVQCLLVQRFVTNTSVFCCVHLSSLLSLNFSMPLFFFTFDDLIHPFFKKHVSSGTLHLGSGSFGAYNTPKSMS
jgi:hypothetical protein